MFTQQNKFEIQYKYNNEILFRNTKIIFVLNLLLIFGRKASWDNLPKEFTQIYNQVTAICQFHNGVELFWEQHFKLSLLLLNK